MHFVVARNTEQTKEIIPVGSRGASKGEVVRKYSLRSTGHGPSGECTLAIHWSIEIVTIEMSEG